MKKWIGISDYLRSDDGVGLAMRPVTTTTGSRATPSDENTFAFLNKTDYGDYTDKDGLGSAWWDATYDLSNEVNRGGAEIPLSYFQ